MTGVMGVGDTSLHRLLGSAERVLARAAAVAIMVLIVLITAQVVARYVFNQALPGIYEAAGLLMVGIVFLGVAYIQSVRGHVRMELLVMRLSPGRRRLVDGFTLLLSLGVVVLITYKSGQNAYESWRMGDVSMGIIDFPTWPAKILVPIGGGLLCLRMIVQLVGHLVPQRPAPLKDEGESMC